MNRFPHCSSSTFASHLQMLFVLSFSPEAALQAEVCPCVVLLSQMVLGALWRTGAVWSCLPGRNSASHGAGSGLRSSAVTVGSPWLLNLPCLSCGWNLSHSALPVFYFQSLFMGSFAALQHPHIFLNLLFIPSVPTLSLVIWMYILLLIKHDSCTCFLFDLIRSWVKF